jgi:hypothetical protein
MTDYEILSLAHRTCWKYKAGTGVVPNKREERETYTFDRATMLEFVRIMRLMEQPNV